MKLIDTSFFFQHLLFRTIGTCLVIASPPEDQRLTVLNEVWKSLVKLKNPEVSLIIGHQLRMCI